MDIGLFVPLSGLNANAEFLRALGPAVEERGFESIWAPEHVVLFDDYSSRYPYSPDGKFPGGGDTGLSPSWPPAPTASGSGRRSA